MRSTTRTARLVAIAAAGTLLLAACGDDDDSGGSGSGDSGSGSAAAEGACESFTSQPPPEAGTLIEPPDGVSRSDGVLHVGSLLPQTGSLSILGPPEFAGVQLAINEINEAGGVLGQPVQYTLGDSGDATTNDTVTQPTTDRLLAAGVDVIIGAASSGVSKNVIDKITSAGVVHYSPANTDPLFTTYEDKGLYFRTAPSDVLQGRILGETIVADGFENVAILARQDDYGTGLQQHVGKTLCENGAVVPVETVYYPEGVDNFDAQVGDIKAANPDAVVLIGFAESSTIIQKMIEQGIGPQDVQLYLVDGNIGNSLAYDADGQPKLPAGVVEGVRGSLPGAEATGDFRERLLAVDPDLVDYSYAAESYDAVVTTALAAMLAGSDAGAEIAKQLADVTRGGEKCTSFVECKELIDAGTTDIDYDGLSGPIEMSDVGDPTHAFVGIYTYGADNRLTDDVDFNEGRLD